MYTDNIFKEYEFMETFIPNQAAGLDFIMAAEELRREDLDCTESQMALPLQKLFDDIVSFISITALK